MGEDSQALGRAIQLARQKGKLTQQQLCHLANMSYSTLAKIERGAIKTPSVFTVARIASVLGITMDDLLGTVVDTSKKAQKYKKTITSANGISFLYMDINGCLVRFFHSAFTTLANDTGISSTTIESIFWHYNDAVCRGAMTVDEFNSVLAKEIGVEKVDWTKYYMDAVEPISEVHSVLTWASKHYKVGLLSNIMPGFITQMIGKKLLPDIEYDTIIDSSETGLIKPEADIYSLAEQKAGVPANEILFVDDSRTNLIAAERLGWQVMWFDDHQPQQSVDKITLALELP